jgi:hypothetical protein
VKFLIDTSPAKMTGLADRELVGGQLLTPLTRYSNFGGTFAIDNGAFSGFDKSSFKSLLEREWPNRERCLFVAVPDVVGSMARTLDLYHHRYEWMSSVWPVALVVQDGAEQFELPWSKMDAVFIGGRDPWKDSQATADIIRVAKILGKHVHVGRVNQIKRYKHFRDLGADTCDGSSIAMFDEKLQLIERSLARDESTPQLPGFDDDGHLAESSHCGNTQAS